MKIKREGGEKEVWWSWEKRELQTDNSKTKLFARKTQTLNCLQRNLNIFIASIYMESRKVLKERMQMVCCLCYSKR